MADTPMVTVDSNSITAVIENMEAHQRRLKQAVKILGDSAAKKMERWAKQNAKWTNRTSNARQGLKGKAVWKDPQTLLIILSHSVDYGIWLELAHERKYAILEQALEEHRVELMSALERLVSQ